MNKVAVLLGGNIDSEGETFINAWAAFDDAVQAARNDIKYWIDEANKEIEPGYHMKEYFFDDDGNEYACVQVDPKGTEIEWLRVVMTELK